MKTILEKLSVRNFKGCQSIDVSFDEFVTEISGANATGKTTVLDALWWLLFNKDSQGSEKFEVRPLDASGEKIHHVNIVVEGAFKVVDDDGERRFVLKKTSIEKWTTKRGAVSAELTGNVNTYEIDGFEKKESEYKSFINGLIEENLFKLLSNPMYFPSLPWKEQREILMNLVSEMPDDALASGLGKFAPIMDDLGKASTDEIAAKYRKELSGLKKEQAELPVRIDEAAMRKVSVDVEGLTKEKSEIEAQIAEIDGYLKSVDTSAQVKSLADEIYALKQKQTELLRLSREEYEANKSEKRMELIKAQALKNSLGVKIAEYQREAERAKTAYESNAKGIERLREEWREIKGLDYDGDTVCPYCEQPLPEAKIESMRAEFAKKQAERLAAVEVKANAAKAEELRLSENIKTAEEKLADANIKYEAILEQVKSIKEELDGLSEPAIPEECYEIDDQISDKEKIAEAVTKTDTTDYEVAKDTFLKRVSEIDIALASVQQNDMIDARIAELVTEQREVAQKALWVEEKVTALEAFVKFKMNCVSDAINNCFDGTITFKLFETQLNGGVRECCECMVEGVPYSSVNSGHKILAGISIIKALQRYFDIAVPLWIDNAESLSSFNIPNVDTQLITLSVSDGELAIK